jgi:hypothetical protein
MMEEVKSQHVAVDQNLGEVWKNEIYSHQISHLEIYKCGLSRDQDT